MIREFSYYQWPDAVISDHPGTHQKLSDTGVDWYFNGKFYRVFEGYDDCCPLGYTPIIPVRRYLYVWNGPEQVTIRRFGRLVSGFNLENWWSQYFGQKLDVEANRAPTEGGLIYVEPGIQSFRVRQLPDLPRLVKGEAPAEEAPGGVEASLFAGVSPLMIGIAGVAVVLALSNKRRK